jgi:hypothetical protein
MQVNPTLNIHLVLFYIVSCHPVMLWDKFFSVKKKREYVGLFNVVLLKYNYKLKSLCINLIK